jgi:hypothetical protein
VPTFLRQLSFILVGVPALLALALSSSGHHGALPFAGVLVCWLSVHWSRNFSVTDPDFLVRGQLELLDLHLKTAVYSSAVCAVAVMSAWTLGGAAHALNLCVLGWWIALALWSLLHANQVAWQFAKESGNT